MRIGLIAPPWEAVPPAQYGGTESVVDQLARGFAARGHDVRLFATGDSRCPVPTSCVFDVADPGRIGASHLEALHVGTAYDELSDCEVVHDHTMMGPLYARAFPDLSVVTTNHGPFDGELSALYRLVARHVPIIAISHAQAATAPVPVAAVIHHGIDVERFPMGDGNAATWRGWAA